MAVASVALELKGALLSRPATCNAAGATGTSGPVFLLALRADNSAQSAENSSSITVIDAVAPAYATLPMASNLAARIVYIRTLDTSPMVLRLTYEVTGVVVLPFRGTFFTETPTDDRVTLIELQGQGSVEWLAAGAIV